MATTRQGAFRLFRFAGIDVFVHWTWLQCVHCHARNPLTQWMTGQTPGATPPADASLVEPAPNNGNPYASPHDFG